jgi:hypothetical protein
LDQAAPLQGWALPEPLQHLRRRLEARMGNRGKREFIQVLRLMEVFSETMVANAALDATYDVTINIKEAPEQIKPSSGSRI